MKNTFKMIGIITFVVLIGFSFPSCGDSDGGGSGGNVTNEKAVYTSLDREGNIYELTITPKSDKAAYEPKIGDLFTLVITFVNGTMKTSEGTVTSQVKNGNTATITLSVSGSTSFSVSVSTSKDEASAIKEINGSIPITESSDGDTSSVDVSDSPLVPYVPVSLIPVEIASYLAKQPANTAASAYNIKLKVTKSEEFATIRNALNGTPNKYVRLDLTGSTITSIEEIAFGNCTNITSVILPDGVTSIGNGAFGWCPNLTSVTIPNGVTSIGYMAFYLSTSLISIRIPDSVTSIGDYAFEVCNSLTSVTIGSGITSIGLQVFSRTGLTSVIIPNSVTTIGDRAFSFCVSLTSVIIPDSVKSIGDYAFSFCDSLASVTFRGTIPSSGFSYTFPDDLRYKFYETDKTNGTPGTYIRIGKNGWTLMP